MVLDVKKLPICKPSQRHNIKNYTIQLQGNLLHRSKQVTVNPLQGYSGLKINKIAHRMCYKVTIDSLLAHLGPKCRSYYIQQIESPMQNQKMSLVASKLIIECIFNTNVCYKITISTALFHIAVVSKPQEIKISYLSEVQRKTLKFLIDSQLFENILQN